MSKESFARFVKSTKRGLVKHSPEILTGLGIAGMISSVVLAAKATPKALQLIEEAKDKADTDKLTVPETIKAAWKPYIPVVLTCSASVACIIGANTVNARRNAALATAYELSRNALTEYKERVVEEIGKEKEQKIQEKVAQKKINETPNASNVIIAGANKVWFLEPVSGRYFQANVEDIRRVINDLNYRLTGGMEEYVSLSEFYDEIVAIGGDLPHTCTSDDLGWNLNRDGQIEIDMPAGKMSNGEPCLVLDYHVAPRYDYSKLS